MRSKNRFIVTFLLNDLNAVIAYGLSIACFDIDQMYIAHSCNHSVIEGADGQAAALHVSNQVNLNHKARESTQHLTLKRKYFFLHHLCFCLLPVKKQHGKSKSKNSLRIPKCDAAVV